MGLNPHPLAITVLAADTNKTYTFTTATRDGIGKFYMGREISKVMGHLGASWLERPKTRTGRKDRFIN